MEHICRVVPLGTRYFLQFTSVRTSAYAHLPSRLLPRENPDVASVPVPMQGVGTRFNRCGGSAAAVDVRPETALGGDSAPPSDAGTASEPTAPTAPTRMITGTPA